MFRILLLLLLLLWSVELSLLVCSSVAVTDDANAAAHKINVTPSLPFHTRGEAKQAAQINLHLWRRLAAAGKAEATTSANRQ